MIDSRAEKEREKMLIGVAPAGSVARRSRRQGTKEGGEGEGQHWWVKKSKSNQLLS